MNYTRQNFVEGQRLTHGHLNHIEDGIIAAGNVRNLLDNSDFRNPVNQRGATSYSGGGTAYSIDRWRLWTTATTLTINEGYIANTESFMVQNLENVDTSKTYTLAGCTADGVIHTLQGKFDGNNYVDDYLRFVGGSLTVGLKPNSWVWAALYEGSYTADTLPPYIPKGYGAELAECQRYYYKTVASNWDGSVCVAIGSSAFAPLYINLPVPMRITPTVTHNVTSCDVFGTGTVSASITNASVDRWKYACMATVSSDYGGKIIKPIGTVAFSADL